MKNKKLFKIILTLIFFFSFSIIVFAEQDKNTDIYYDGNFFWSTSFSFIIPIFTLSELYSSGSYIRTSFGIRTNYGIMFGLESGMMSFPSATRYLKYGDDLGSREIFPILFFIQLHPKIGQIVYFSPKVSFGMICFHNLGIRTDYLVTSGF